MPTIIPAQPATSTTTRVHRPWCKRHPLEWNECELVRRARGTTMQLHLLQEPGQPAKILVTGLPDRGVLTMAQAGALAAALDAVRALAATTQPADQ